MDLPYGNLLVHHFKRNTESWMGINWAVKRFWVMWKHAIGTFDEEDGYDARNENHIAVIRTLILLLNVTCGVFIIANIIRHW